MILKDKQKKENIMNTMEHRRIVDSREKLVKDACFSKTNIFESGIWMYHIIFVIKYSKMLA